MTARTWNRCVAAFEVAAGAVFLGAILLTVVFLLTVIGAVMGA